LGDSIRAHPSHAHTLSPPHNNTIPSKQQATPGANRFWPCPGNHDVDSSTLNAYLAAFPALSNQRYYDIRINSSSSGAPPATAVHFFLLNSNSNEPDGITAGSAQAAWLAGALAASTAPFKIVVLHHPPFSSGSHGSTLATQW
jgi:hypothetical protein